MPRDMVANKTYFNFELYVDFEMQLCRYLRLFQTKSQLRNLCKLCTTQSMTLL